MVPCFYEKITKKYKKNIKVLEKLKKKEKKSLKNKEKEIAPAATVHIAREPQMSAHTYIHTFTVLPIFTDI